MNQRHSMISTSSAGSNSQKQFSSPQNNQPHQIPNVVTDLTLVNNGVATVNGRNPNFGIPQVDPLKVGANGNGQSIYGCIYETTNCYNNVLISENNPQISLLDKEQADRKNDNQRSQFQPIYNQNDKSGVNLPIPPNVSRTIQSFHAHKNVTSQQHSPISSIDSTSSTPLMPINVKGMLLHGVVDSEIIRSWLVSIKCGDLVKNFLDHGYDMPLLTRMTPQDLAAIGCKTPALRKKLLAEIKKLNLEDDIPNFRPHSLEKWLELLKLSEYHDILCNEGYDCIDKACDLTWEDLEEIGITKLGHQKRLLIGIERIKKFDKQQEEKQSDNSIYDVHPNHRISLNQNGTTLNRAAVRSGFFQTRSGANLDHRGLPVATVMPALKHVNSALANLDITQQTINPRDPHKYNGCEQNRNVQASGADQSFNLSDLTATLKKNPPPLPPVRTNSLKMPFDTDTVNGSGIYGRNSLQNSAVASNSTSFFRSSRVPTLATHCQVVNCPPNSTRTMFPVREAPLPPVPLQNSVIPEALNESSSLSMNNFQAAELCGVTQSSIGPSIEHQIGSADEFPPPPPCQ